MKRESFLLFADFLKRASGLQLERDQEYLLDARLSSLLELYDCADLDALAAHVRDKTSPRLLRHVTEAMATHESSFLRDASVFSFFQKNILPSLMAEKADAKNLRFWSAGCASGQEPYSIAMILQEEAEKLNGWTTEIVATDLSEEILERARNGVYSHFEAQRGLPIRLLLKYFTQAGDDWHIHPSIRHSVDFRHGNLLDDVRAEEPFDVIFCRNVLMYVDTDAKRNIIRKFHTVLRPQGWLILGAVETAPDHSGFRWETGVPGVFRKSD